MAMTSIPASPLRAQVRSELSKVPISPELPTGAMFDGKTGHYTYVRVMERMTSKNSWKPTLMTLIPYGRILLVTVDLKDKQNGRVTREIPLPWIDRLVEGNFQHKRDGKITQVLIQMNPRTSAADVVLNFVRDHRNLAPCVSAETFFERVQKTSQILYNRSIPYYKRPGEDCGKLANHRTDSSARKFMPSTRRDYAPPGVDPAMVRKLNERQASPQPQSAAPQHPAPPLPQSPPMPAVPMQSPVGHQRAAPPLQESPDLGSFRRVHSPGKPPPNVSQPTRGIVPEEGKWYEMRHVRSALRMSLTDHRPPRCVFNFHNLVPTRFQFVPIDPALQNPNQPPQYHLKHVAPDGKDYYVQASPMEMHPLALHLGANPSAKGSLRFYHDPRTLILWEYSSNQVVYPVTSQDGSFVTQLVLDHLEEEHTEDVAIELIETSPPSTVLGPAVPPRLRNTASPPSRRDNITRGSASADDGRWYEMRHVRSAVRMSLSNQFPRRLVFDHNAAYPTKFQFVPIDPALQNHDEPPQYHLKHVGADGKDYYVQASPMEMHPLALHLGANPYARGSLRFYHDPRTKLLWEYSSNQVVYPVPPRDGVTDGSQLVLDHLELENADEVAIELIETSPPSCLASPAATPQTRAAPLAVPPPTAVAAPLAVDAPPPAAVAAPPQRTEPPPPARPKSAQEIADGLYVAMKGLGTDEDRVWGDLRHVQNQEHWRGVARCFETSYPAFHDGRVVGSLKEDLTKKEFAKAAQILAERDVDIMDVDDVQQRSQYSESQVAAEAAPAPTPAPAPVMPPTSHASLSGRVGELRAGYERFLRKHDPQAVPRAPALAQYAAGNEANAYRELLQAYPHCLVADADFLRTDAPPLSRGAGPDKSMESLSQEVASLKSIVLSQQQQQQQQGSQAGRGTTYDDASSEDEAPLRETQRSRARREEGSDGEGAGPLDRRYLIPLRFVPGANSVSFRGAPDASAGSSPGLTFSSDPASGAPPPKESVYTAMREARERDMQQRVDPYAVHVHPAHPDPFAPNTAPPMSNWESHRRALMYRTNLSPDPKAYADPQTVASGAYQGWHKAPGQPTPQAYYNH